MPTVRSDQHDQLEAVIGGGCPARISVGLHPLGQRRRVRHPDVRFVAKTRHYFSGGSIAVVRLRLGLKSSNLRKRSSSSSKGFLLPARQPASNLRELGTMSKARLRFESCRSACRSCGQETRRLRLRSGELHGGGEGAGGGEVVRRGRRPEGQGSRFRERVPGGTPHRTAILQTRFRLHERRDRASRQSGERFSARSGAPCRTEVTWS